MNGGRILLQKYTTIFAAIAARRLPEGVLCCPVIPKLVNSNYSSQFTGVVHKQNHHSRTLLVTQMRSFKLLFSHEHPVIDNTAGHFGPFVLNYFLMLFISSAYRLAHSVRCCSLNLADIPN